MLGNVFLKSLRDQRRSFVWWAIGLAAVTLLTVLFYPSIEGSPELNELLGDEDSIMRAFVETWRT
jgi:ABC-2 type transport system permease protein